MNNEERIVLNHHKKAPYGAFFLPGTLFFEADFYKYIQHLNPSGRKVFFSQSQNRGRRKWEILGGTDKMNETEARKLASVRISTIKEPGVKRQLETILFEDVGVMFFDRYTRHWKPSTHKSSLGSYQRHIVPFFQGMLIGDINKIIVDRWFASLGNRPGIANRCLPILSVMMQQAELYGYRPDNSNPCKGKPRYKTALKERFLSADELSRLGGVLEDYREISPLAVSYLELVILTGCRKGEMAGLHWSSYRHDNLYLPDSKTGPKTIYLSTAARAVLDAIPRTAPGFSRPCGAPARGAKARPGFVSMHTGALFGNNPAWPVCDCMTFATLTPASPWNTASIF